MAMSAIAAVLSASMTLPSDAGFVLAIGTVTVLLAVSVLLSDLVLLAVGTLGTLLVLPAAVIEWFPASDAAPFVLLALGLLLVAVAVWTSRRHRETSAYPSRDSQRLPKRAAVAAATAVVVVAAAVTFFA
jgi:hypothetical protein